MQGLFTPDQEKLISDALFDLINRKRKIPRFVKFIIRMIIRKIDDRKLDRLPDHWKQALIPVVDAAFLKDMEALQKQVATVMNNEIDIPRMSEPAEQVMFEMFAKLIALALQKYVFKNAGDAPSPGA